IKTSLEAYIIPTDYKDIGIKVSIEAIVKEIIYFTSTITQIKEFESLINQTENLPSTITKTLNLTSDINS
ncbi:MAG: hypothetical protein ACTSRJ_04835, partial [Candidatus Hodarchaeales archaeon]